MTDTDRPATTAPADRVALLRLAVERNAARSWSAAWGAVARRYRMMLRVHRDREPISHAEFARFVQEAQDMRQARDRLAVEIAAVRELVGAQDDETTLAAARDMMGEHEHYFRSTERAYEHIIPALTAERDALAAALREAERRAGELRTALLKLNAIRDQCVRTQRAGWSTVIYPLVRILDEAGIASTVTGDELLAAHADQEASDA